MRKRNRVILIAACLLLALTPFGLLARDSEPRYHGRSLSKWLVLYWSRAGTQDSPEDKQAEQAIRAIGTNALPYLLRWIQHEPPSWHRAARVTLPESVSESAPARLLVDGPGYERAGGAMLAFIILGTNATSSIPYLVTMIKDTNHPRTAARALAALSCLGAPAFPHMSAALADTNQIHRVRIALNLGFFMARDVGTNVCLPPLKAVLNDPDPEVRAAASRALSRLTNTPSQ